MTEQEEYRETEPICHSYTEHLKHWVLSFITATLLLLLQIYMTRFNVFQLTVLVFQHATLASWSTLTALISIACSAMQW